MKTGHRIFLLGTVGWVGLLGAWSHQRFSQKGAHPETAELYEAVAHSLPDHLGGDWLKVSEGGTRTGDGQGLDLQGASEAFLRDYPELRRAEHVEFGSVRHGNLEAEVDVFFVLPGGRVSRCTFRFRFENRGWKVQGVEFGKPDAQPIGGIRV